MYSKIFRYNVLYAILYCSCIKYWLLQLIAYLLKLSMKIRQFWKLFKICTSVTLKSLNLQQMQSSEKNFLWINLTKRFYLQLFQREQKRRNNVQFFKAFDWTNMNSTITDFSPLSHFYTPWKRQKTISFQGVWKCDIGGEDFDEKIVASCFGTLITNWVANLLNLKRIELTHGCLSLRLCKFYDGASLQKRSTIYVLQCLYLLFILFILSFNSVENPKKRHSKKNVLAYIYRINTN